MRPAGNPLQRYFAGAFGVLFALAILGIAASPSSLHAARKKKEEKPSIPESVFTPDKGKFSILLGGQEIGSEEFEISRSGGAWIARGSTTAHAPGGVDIKATGQLKLADDGTPIRYDWSAEAKKKATGAVVFDNGTAKCVANLGSASPMMKDFKFASPRIAVLDNNLYHQYAVLAQIYDWKAGGKQSFPVVIPQDLTPGTISVESIGPQDVGNAKYEALRVSTSDLEILLYVDSHEHLMRLEVPASKVVIERE
ncbi:MAG: hypothetical protein ACRD4Y_06050 [Candidatus Acidiferrales bacterium]